jgi:plastocyanin
MLFVDVFGGAARSDAATRLNATVGPKLTITLKTVAGRSVKTLKPGSYTIVVRDRSKLHNFHLIGPTKVLNRSTSVRFMGMRTWYLTLLEGTYRFVCDPHARLMKGTFRVI